MRTSYIKYFTIIFFLTLLIISVSAQDLRNKTITINLENKTFIETLNLLKKKYNLKISYRSELIPKSKIISAKATNSSLEKFLKTILQSVELDYKIINDHIVLIKAPPKPIIKQNNPSKDVKSYATINEIPAEKRIITVYDTIYKIINDTVTYAIYDTIQISITDTIYYYKKLDPIKKEIEIEDEIFISNVRFGISFNYSLNLPIKTNHVYSFDYTLGEVGNNTSTFNYSTGHLTDINLIIDHKKMIYNAGIGLTLINENIILNNTLSSMTSNLITIDSYRELYQDSVNWINVMRENIYTQIDTCNEFNVNRKLYFFNLPFQLKYIFYTSGKTDYNINGGFLSGILLIKYEETPLNSFTNENILNSKFILSYNVGIGIIYNISDCYSFSLDLCYRSYISDNANYYSFKIGFIKTFN